MFARDILAAIKFRCEVYQVLKLAPAPDYGLHGFWLGSVLFDNRLINTMVDPYFPEDLIGIS